MKKLSFLFSAFLLFAMLLAGCEREAPLKPVTEEEAQEYAHKFIEATLGHEPDSILNETTTIADTVPLYGWRGTITFYLCRLETDGVQTGFALIDTSTGPTRGVTMAAPEGDCPVDVIAKEKLGRPITKEDHIISPWRFFYVIKDDYYYRDFETGKIVMPE